MATTEENLELISILVKNSLQEQLTIIRPSRGFDGERKPKNPKYFTAISNRVNTGLLYDSINITYDTNENGDLVMVLDFGDADYWKFVDGGRRGKKQDLNLRYPPLDTILRWSAQRGIAQFRDEKGRFISNLERAYLLQRSIGEYGIFPTNFVQNGIDAVIGKVEFYFGEWAVNFLTELLEEGRIIVRTR